MSAKTSKKIYLAGPDVFHKNPEESFSYLEKLCLERGLNGIRPSDGGLSAGFTGTKNEISQRIYEANIELIRNCDGVVANLSPFRGSIEPDSGTVFEVGMAVALGKTVVGYLPNSKTSYEEKVSELFGHGERTNNGGIIFDNKFHMMIEEFDRPLNLMISCSTSIYETAEMALEKMSLILNKSMARARISI